MSKLEKLERFTLKNPELLNLKGGGPLNPDAGVGEVTGGGSYVEYNWPQQGVNTCITYTSDYWDGVNEATMQRRGTTEMIMP